MREATERLEKMRSITDRIWLLWRRTPERRFEDLITEVLENAGSTGYRTKDYQIGDELNRRLAVDIEGQIGQ